MTHHALRSRRTADVPEAHETDGHGFHLEFRRFCAMVRLTVGKRCRDYTKQGPFLPKAAVAAPCETVQSPGGRCKRGTCWPLGHLPRRAPAVRTLPPEA